MHGSAPTAGPLALPGMHEKEVKQNPHSGREMHSVGSSTAQSESHDGGVGPGAATVKP